MPFWEVRPYACLSPTSCGFTISTSTVHPNSDVGCSTSLQRHRSSSRPSTPNYEPKWQPTCFTIMAISKERWTTKCSRTKRIPRRQKCAMWSICRNHTSSIPWPTKASRHRPTASSTPTRGRRSSVRERTSTSPSSKPNAAASRPCSATMVTTTTVQTTSPIWPTPSNGRDMPHSR